MAEFRLLPFALLREPPMPVRSVMDDTKMRELEDSIRAQGILQPLIVCPADAAAQPWQTDNFPSTLDSYIAVRGAFEVIAGHRRYKAALAVGLQAVPCIVHPAAGIAREAIMIHENACREDVSPAEEARYFAELIERYDLTEEALLKLVRKGPDYVYARLNLLRGDQQVLDALEERKITLAVARELNKVKDETARRRYLALAMENGATARVVRAWATHAAIDAVGAPAPTDTSGLPASYLDPNAGRLECVMCGPVNDPYNLTTVYVHKHELEAFRLVMRMMRERMAAGLPLGAYLQPASGEAPQPPQR